MPKIGIKPHKVMLSLQRVESHFLRKKISDVLDFEKECRIFMKNFTLQLLIKML